MTGTVAIPLTGKRGQGKVALIDAADYDLVKNYKWKLTKYGYAATLYECGPDESRAKRPRRLLHLHQLICPVQPGQVTDHINRNRLDNRRSNLRAVTFRQNAHNRSAFGVTSQYKGVTKKKHGWSASCNGRHLGIFPDEKIAALAFDKAARLWQGEFAVLNFPNERLDASVPIRHVDYAPDQKELPVGVSYARGNKQPRRKPWKATYRKQFLGYYATVEEAVAACQAAKDAFAVKATNI